jgi:hypothetical protein
VARATAASKFGPTFDSESIHSAHVEVFRKIGGVAMGSSNHGRRNEPLRRGDEHDEHDEYDEVPGEVSSLLEENARLRGLVVELSRMIRKGVAEQG